MKTFNHHLKQFILQGGSKDPYITLKAGNVSLASTVGIGFSRFSLCTTFRFKGKTKVPNQTNPGYFNAAIFHLTDNYVVKSGQNMHQGLHGLYHSTHFQLINNYKDNTDNSCICRYTLRGDTNTVFEERVNIPAFDGNWHKIVAVFDCDQIRLYDNGELKHTINALPAKKEIYDPQLGFKAIINGMADDTCLTLYQGFNRYLSNINYRKDHRLSYKNIYIFPYPLDLPDLPNTFKSISEAKRKTLYTLDDYNKGNKVDPKILKGCVNINDGHNRQYIYLNLAINKGSGTGNCIRTTSDDSGTYDNKRRIQFTDCTFSQIEGNIEYSSAGPFSLIGPGVWCKYELDVDVDIFKTDTGERANGLGWREHTLLCRLDGNYSNADYYKSRYYYLFDTWICEARDINTGELISSTYRFSDNIADTYMPIYKGEKVLGKKYRFICYCRVADEAFTDVGLLNGAHSVKPKIIFNSATQTYKITGNIDLVDFRILGCGMAIENMGNLYKAYESNDIMVIPGETGIKFEEPLTWEDPYLEAGKGIWPGMMSEKVTGENWYNNWRSSSGARTRYIKDYDVSNDTELKTKYGLDKAIQLVNEGIIPASNMLYGLRPTTANYKSTVPYWTSFIRPKIKSDIIIKSDIDDKDIFNKLTQYTFYGFSVGGEYTNLIDLQFGLAGYSKTPKKWFRFQQNIPKLSHTNSMRGYTSSSNVTTQPQIGIVASAFSYINTGLTSNSTLEEQEAVYSKPWWVVAKCSFAIEGYNYADMLIVGDDHTAFETYNTNN